MNKYTSVLLLAAVAVICAGCGTKQPEKAAAETFAMGANAPAQDGVAAADEPLQAGAGQTDQSGALLEDTPLAPSTDIAATDAAAGTGSSVSPSPSADKTGALPTGDPTTVAPNTGSTAAEAAGAPKTANSLKHENLPNPAKSLKPTNAPNAEASAKSAGAGKPAANQPPVANSSTVPPKAPPSAAPASSGSQQTATVTPKPAAASTNEITWSQFFDNDEQTTPSSHFWDLNGQTVQIKGFMGEVLSFDKHWFLLIPKPGAECPFDNGDETYWNKIMIVFVPDDIKLRYTSDPLLVTGKLDVGIKLDESGYKTMFRLYNASFEKMKE